MSRPELGKLGKLDVCIVKGGPSPSSLQVFTPSGEELPGVLSLEVPKVVHNSTVKAKIEMLVGLEVLANPVVDLEFVKAAAKVYGYRLVQVPRNGTTE